MINQYTPLILAYHSVSYNRTDSLSVKADLFDAQLKWLKENNYSSITLNKILRGQKKTVIITFDDGYRDNYNVAFPILKKYGFTATLFITVDYMDTDHIYWWDLDKIGKYGERNDFSLMTWDQVKVMLDYGFEIGSHTNRHPILTEISEKQSLKEIRSSRTNIRERLNCDVNAFCYPAGQLNDTIINSVKDAGYRYAVVTPTASNIPNSTFTLRRVGVYHNTSMFKFKLKTRALIQYLIEKCKKNQYKR